MADADRISSSVHDGKDGTAAQAASKDGREKYTPHHQLSAGSRDSTGDSYCVGLCGVTGRWTKLDNRPLPESIHRKIHSFGRRPSPVDMFPKLASLASNSIKLG